MRRDAVHGFPASVRRHSWVTVLPISSWRARCVHSRLTGLIVNLRFGEGDNVSKSVPKAPPESVVLYDCAAGHEP